MPPSDVTIRTLKPRDKAYKVSDFVGLLLTVKPTGSRLWHFKYRIAGKEKLLSLGTYPGISLAQARAARDAAYILLAAGQDPGEAKQDRKREDQEHRSHTFEKMAQAYKAKTVKEGKAIVVNSKKHWALQLGSGPSRWSHWVLRVGRVGHLGSQRRMPGLRAAFATTPRVKASATSGLSCTW